MEVRVAPEGPFFTRPWSLMGTETHPGILTASWLSRQMEKLGLQSNGAECFLLGEEARDGGPGV